MLEKRLIAKHGAQPRSGSLLIRVSDGSWCLTRWLRQGRRPSTTGDQGQ